MYTPRLAAALFVACLALSSCATTPKTPLTRYAALFKSASARPPGCLTEGVTVTGSLHHQPAIVSEDCQRAVEKWRLKVARAKALLPMAELEAAPACLRQFQLPQDYFEITGVDPESAHAVAAIIARGYAVSSVLRSPCAVDVCNWQSIKMPRTDCVYCSANALTGGTSPRRMARAQEVRQWSALQPSTITSFSSWLAYVPVVWSAAGLARQW